MKKLVLLTALFLFMIPVINCSADEIKGKVASVDVNTNTFNISGVTVIASGSQIKNRDGKHIPFSAIAAGDYLEVEGSFTGASQITAEMIEKDFAEEDYVSGRIESFNVAQKTVDISGITIKVSQDVWNEDCYDIPTPVQQFDTGNYIACNGKWSGMAEFIATSVQHKLAYERVFEELKREVLTMHIFGAISVVLFVVCYIPQIVAILKTKCVSGISVGMWVICVLGFMVGLIYVIWLKAVVLIVNYVISFALSVWTLIMVLYYRNKNRIKTDKC